MPDTHGRCLCGAVNYTVTGPLRPVVFCHCKMCRRASGHFVAATACTLPQLSIQPTEQLKWYHSSSEAQRGFCGQCGSNLFWKPTGGTYVSIWAGTLDDPTGLNGTEHIYVADKGDYYTLDDRLPKSSQNAPHSLAPAACRLS
jgi:hypothetical protein